MNEQEFDFLDFGAGKGGSLDFARRRLGGRRGLGIDKSRKNVEQLRNSGYDCIEGDITTLDLDDKAVKFVVMSHILEHLPDLDAVRQTIAGAVRISQDFIFIQGPWFDADDYLEKLGLKLYWSDWRGHPCHLTTRQLGEILRSMELTEHVIMGRDVISGSGDSAIHPLNSPGDQHDYEPQTHPEKPEITFDLRIYREMVCLVRLRPLPNWDQLLKARHGCEVIRAIP